ncbi:antibiotic biosynthesis monooxygenase family protein [Herbaspirillum sp. GCM10030257]|uniref:antibiotic biosynthesis monooxygenase family protein n=1 Tax=Herbaspirillum sp. GCM10030257 TaxID=3273393 RepID=UPI00360932DB
MLTAAFIFKPGKRDAEFDRLNALISEAARATGGFLGEESWQSADGQLLNATYYWDSMEALKRFSSHPKHLEAKREYQHWYGQFHVVISEVVQSYGDGGLEHLTPNERMSTSPMAMP